MPTNAGQRPRTAADAVLRANAKARIAFARSAERGGLMLAILGAVQALRPARILESAAVRLRLADHVWLLTWRQAFAAAAIPLGLLLGMAGYLLHRRYVRFAKELPFFIGALDSAIE